MFDEVIVRKVIGQIVENDQGNKKSDSRDQCGFADSKDHFGSPDISTTRTGEEEFRSSGVQEFRSSGVQEFRSSGVQEFRVARIAKLQGGKRLWSRISDQPSPVQCRLLNS
jgi:hypothetical protein